MSDCCNCSIFFQRESNRLLDWFKEIKEAHGSVEVTSLNQVDAIRQRGIFKVRRLRSDQKRQDQDQLVRFVFSVCVITFTLLIWFR